VNKAMELKDIAKEDDEQKKITKVGITSLKSPCGRPGKFLDE
jgi:hypothetical protein